MPTFFARRDYTILDTDFVQVADTNGDGVPDLIASANGYIEVLLGIGNGTFGTGSNSNIGVDGSFCFAATSLVAGGTTDLVLSVADGIAVSMGNGNGTFQPAVYYTVSDGGMDVLVLGDFNGDGIQDVATPGDQGVWLFTGKGDGTFNPGVLAAAVPSSQALIAAADFNADGNLDLVVSSANGGFLVLLGNGKGTFQPPQAFPEPKEVLAIAAGPLAKGGNAGIAVGTNANSYVYLYSGNGAGGFSGPTFVELPGVTEEGLTLGEVNGDGIPDLISGEAYVAYGEGGGHFSKPVSYTIGGYFRNILLTDLTNNGLNDIVTSGYSALSVLLNEGKAQFEDGIWTAVTGGASCGAGADFNGDGKPDLAVVTSTGVSILLGTGKAATPFSTGTPITVAGAACVVTGDLNGDGIPDLLVSVNGSPNALLAYLGNGNGTFTLKSTTATPNSGGYVVLGDFNHDAKLDFATSGNLMALGNGDGTFQTPTAIVASPPVGGFSGIAAGDINNDGWTDLVLTNAETPIYTNVFVLLNNEKGGFTQVPTNFGEFTQQPVLADLNNDGNLDLILCSSGGTGAIVYSGNGTGAFTSEVFLTGPYGANGFNVVADVNGDGIPDVLTLGEDTLAVYLGEGNFTYAPPFNIGTGPSPANVLVEDLHGQAPKTGLPDIVAPDTSGGVIVLLNLTK